MTKKDDTAIVWKEENYPEEKYSSASTEIQHRTVIEISSVNDVFEPMVFSISYFSPICQCDSQEAIFYCSKEKFIEIAKKMLEMAGKAQDG